MELTAADKTIRNRKEEGEENSPRKTDPASRAYTSGAGSNFS